MGVVIASRTQFNRKRSASKRKIHLKIIKGIDHGLSELLRLLRQINVTFNNN